MRIALVGNPNCGKTTLINALTGSRLQVGNWPGVTVERKSGFMDLEGQRIEVIDLPGTYSLTALGESRSLDEHIACDFIQHEPIDLLINVLDGTNLERNLYLTTQLLDLQVPMLVVVTMMDVVQKRQLTLDISALAKRLACPVIPLNNKTSDLEALKRAIAAVNLQARPTVLTLPAVIEQALSDLCEAVGQVFPGQSVRAKTLQLLEQTPAQWSLLPAALQQQLERQQQAIHQHEEVDLLLADSRYSFAHDVAQHVLTAPAAKPTHTAWIDRIVLNRFLGIPIFLLVMYGMFFVAINVGGAFQDFFDLSSQAIFVQGFGQALTAIHCPAWLNALLADGAGRGINTTVTFIPVIGMLFLCLSFLEGSGYMVRAAFVMDRLMQALGLPGKSFVPMIIGFGCNVPAILAARTLDRQRDRILTIIMAPFMSCSARLAIFAVFTSAFFPQGGQNIVFALYVIGIAMAVLTGWLLRKTLLPGPPSPFIMEMPPYHWPSLRLLARQTGLRLKGFISKAGVLIVPICVLIGGLNALTWHGLAVNHPEQTSLLALLGQSLTPLFAPMGIDANNWPATVGLLTGTLAKEVVVGTLNTLYSQMGHLAQVTSVEPWFQTLQQAWQSLPDNLAKLVEALRNPIAASIPDHQIDQGVYGVMAARFHHPAAAFAYLLFVLLYVPCASTIAVMAKELHKAWAWFSIGWSITLAYATAVLFYQAATFAAHPGQSLGWFAAVASVFVGGVWAMRRRKTICL